ncbi:cupin domain-containing protein [Sphaerisporangium sp. NPDC051017]|uniref:cupin domain-containing protein n=1 Tax=Sphaerisporangium sp. NPDC051017 TaxID=3154636 RepID=UPI0034395C50
MTDEVNEPSIGERLRELRSAHGLSIRALSERAKVSTSVISEVERGKTEPSISTLKHLATALGTSITYFFTSPAQSNGHVIRADDRKTIIASQPSTGDGRSSIEAKGIRFELASPDASEVLEALYGRYEKDASTGEEMYTHDGEEWAMVLAGRFKITLGDEVYFLDPGDSIWFKSNIPHRITNVADGVSEYIWMNTPKSF